MDYIIKLGLTTYVIKNAASHIDALMKLEKTLIEKKVQDLLYHRDEVTITRIIGTIIE